MVAEVAARFHTTQSKSAYKESCSVVIPMSAIGHSEPLSSHNVYPESAFHGNDLTERGVELLTFDAMKSCLDLGEAAKDVMGSVS